MDVMIPPPSDLRVALDVAREGVAGFPLWLGVTVRNAGRNLIECGLPTISRVGSIAVGITVPGEVAIPAIDPTTSHGAPPGYALSPGEARTFLVDLGDVCGTIAPGDHTLVLSLPGERAIGRAQIRVVPPTDGERDLALHLCSDEGWLRSMVLDPRERDVHWSSLSARVRWAISIYAVLRRATWAPRLSDVPLPMLRGFTGVLEGDAAVLAYEVARAGADPSAPALRREVIARWPTLGWRIDEVDADLGLLATLRELARL
jgi:hypothetical protein